MCVAGSQQVPAVTDRAARCAMAQTGPEAGTGAQHLGSPTPQPCTVCLSVGRGSSFSLASFTFLYSWRLRSACTTTPEGHRGCCELQSRSCAQGGILPNVFTLSSVRGLAFSGRSARLPATAMWGTPGHSLGMCFTQSDSLVRFDLNSGRKKRCRKSSGPVS